MAGASVTFLVTRHFDPIADCERETIDTREDLIRRDENDSAANVNRARVQPIAGAQSAENA